MPYLIEYYSKGQKLVAEPWKGTMAGARYIAEDGLKRHKADSYRITDDDTGAEVASGRC